jgi:anti-sigma regulatory factor (Ser/Thr protein kinase)
MGGAGGLQLHAELPPEAASVARARELVRSLFARTDLGVDQDIVLLLVSELVSNAIVHARGNVGINAQQVGSSLRVEVRDSSSTLPAVQVGALDDVSGRGLHLVERLADRWGSRRLELDEGKTVWFELDPGR